MKIPVRRLLEGKENQEIYAVPPETTVREAVAGMAERNIGSVCVVSADRLVGLFTERDLLDRVVTPGRDPARTKLSHVLTGNPLCLDAESTVEDALRLIDERGVRHMPVVENEGLIGVISIRDLTEFLVRDQQARIDDVVGSARVAFS
jgi:CBS domain-containing protein